MPVVVERDLQILQVRIEVVAKVSLHAQRGDARVVPPHDDENELERTDHDEQPGHRDKASQVVLGDRAVDDELDHLGDRCCRDEAAELGQAEHDDEPDVRPQIGHVAA